MLDDFDGRSNQRYRWWIMLDDADTTDGAGSRHPSRQQSVLDLDSRSAAYLLPAFFLLLISHRPRWQQSIVDLVG